MYYNNAYMTNEEYDQMRTAEADAEEAYRDQEAAAEVDEMIRRHEAEETVWKEAIPIATGSLSWDNSVLDNFRSLETTELFDSQDESSPDCEYEFKYHETLGLFVKFTGFADPDYPWDGMDTTDMSWTSWINAKSLIEQSQSYLACNIEFFNKELGLEHISRMPTLKKSLPRIVSIKRQELPVS